LVTLIFVLGEFIVKLSVPSIFLKVALVLHFYESVTLSSSS